MNCGILTSKTDCMFYSYIRKTCNCHIVLPFLLTNAAYAIQYFHQEFEQLQKVVVVREWSLDKKPGIQRILKLCTRSAWYGVKGESVSKKVLKYRESSITAGRQQRNVILLRITMNWLKCKFLRRSIETSCWQSFERHANLFRLADIVIIPPCLNIMHVYDWALWCPTASTVNSNSAFSVALFEQLTLSESALQKSSESIVAFAACGEHEDKLAGGVYLATVDGILPYVLRSFARVLEKFRERKCARKSWRMIGLYWSW